MNRRLTGRMKIQERRYLQEKRTVEGEELYKMNVTEIGMQTWVFLRI